MTLDITLILHIAIILLARSNLDSQFARGISWFSKYNFRHTCSERVRGSLTFWMPLFWAATPGWAKISAYCELQVRLLRAATGRSRVDRNRISGGTNWPPGVPGTASRSRTCRNSIGRVVRRITVNFAARATYVLNNSRGIQSNRIYGFAERERERGGVRARGASWDYSNFPPEFSPE